MIPKITIILILLASWNTGHSQTLYEVKDTKYRIIADSIIKQSINSEFKDAIRYSLTMECFYDTVELKPNEFKNIESQKGVKVCYDFVTECNQTYSYETNLIRGGGFEIIFDMNHCVIKLPDFDFLKDVSKIHKNCFISFETAEQIAKKNTNKRSRKTWNNNLVYNLSTNNVYWSIVREHGFRKGMIETIKIDAKSKKIIEKTAMPYRKKFFEAL